MAESTGKPDREGVIPDVAHPPTSDRPGATHTDKQIATARLLRELMRRMMRTAE